MTNPKRPNPYADRPYAVGKGKPPAHTRWQPGQSGNPRRGPSRSPKTFGEALDKAAARKVKVVINGKPVKMSRLEVAAEVAVDRATKGDFRAIDRLSKRDYGGYSAEELLKEIERLMGELEHAAQELEELRSRRTGLMVIPDYGDVCYLEAQMRANPPEAVLQYIREHPGALEDFVRKKYEKRHAFYNNGQSPDQDSKAEGDLKPGE
jgi:hypothetical protein